MIAARRTRLTLITLAATVMITITVVAYVALPHYNYWRLTGSWSPIKIIEKLESPVPVRGWSEDRLLSADGQTILLPGFRKLPKTSKALFEATKRGVEITPDGLVVGLVRVHHWCGNDPVEEHITRVDLSQMLTFLREGERLTPLSEDEKKIIPPHFSDEFSEYGWRVEGFGLFRVWSDYMSPAHAAQENHGRPL